MEPSYVSIFWHVVDRLRLAEISPTQKLTSGTVLSVEAGDDKNGLVISPMSSVSLLSNLET